MGETFGGELGFFATGAAGCCDLAGSSDPGGGRGGPLDGPAEGGSGLTGIPGLEGNFKDGRGGGFCSAINYLLSLVYV